MSRWFRFYDDAINDPKILKLSEDLRWHWVAVLCIASKHDGILPDMGDIAIMLRISRARATALFTQLATAGLLDRTETGFAPHNWNGRQYKSDVSTSRVKRFRNGQRNVSETPPETDTETDTERPSVAKIARAKKRAGPLPSDWVPSVKAYAIAEQFGQNVQIVEGIFRDYVASSGKLYADHDAAFHNFIRNQNSFNRGASHGTDKIQSRSGSLTASLRRDLAALEQSDGSDFTLPDSGFLRISG